jgi:hypothetical protein
MRQSEAEGKYGRWCDSEFDGGNLTGLSDITVIILRPILVLYLLTRIMPSFIAITKV